MNPDVVVVGGGAAGLVAARAASLRGLQTILIERNGRCGRKLLITGKGRCNVTNTADPDEFLRNTVTNGRFLFSAMSRFGQEDIRNLLRSAGVPTKEERGGRVFPESDRSSDVVRALETLAQKAGVRTMAGSRVQSVEVADGTVRSVRLYGGETIFCRGVILCTGGMSYPATGSDGDGYKIARALGHTIITPRPALVPIILADGWTKRLEGLSLRNIRISLIRNKNTVFDGLGEMVFTDMGISGPLALSASSHMKDDAGAYKIVLDLKPGLDHGKLGRRILRDFGIYSNKRYKNALGDLLPKKLIPTFIELSGIDPDRPVHQITGGERADIVRLLKGWTVQPHGLASFKEAVITSGGIHVKQVHPATMESRLVRGLYFAGEILDVDALTGGYNLTIAFSTGHAAGTHCLNGRGRDELDDNGEQGSSKGCADDEHFSRPR